MLSLVPLDGLVGLKDPFLVRELARELDAVLDDPLPSPEMGSSKEEFLPPIPPTPPTPLNSVTWKLLLHSPWEISAVVDVVLLPT